MISSNSNFKIISLDTVKSTNIYALELLRRKKVQEGTVIWSFFQEEGNGQRENKWYSTPYKNLMFSLIIEPNLEVTHQFLLSQKITMAVVYFLDSLSVGKVEVKWPNDILIDSKKVAGILIENSIQGSRINNSVIGIGLNVNETTFPSFFRDATSLKLATGTSFIIEEILHALLISIKKELLNKIPIHERYLMRMYGYSQLASYEDKDEVFEGTIVGVLPNGALQMNKNGKLRTYENKEIKFLT